MRRKKSQTLRKLRSNYSAKTLDWTVRLLSNVLSENQQEEWIGDLFEARRNLLDAGWSEWATLILSLLRIAFLLWSYLRVKCDDLLSNDPQAPEGLKDIIGLEMFIRTASATDTHILVAGGTAAARHTLASEVHANSKYRDGFFCIVDCASIDESDLSELLFGSAKHGADRVGAGTMGSNKYGTVFLDNIPKLSLQIQAELVKTLHKSRSLRDQSFRLIGGSAVELEQVVRAAKFRVDLWYIISALNVALSPLGDRIRKFPA
jgi:transcriptional regulator with PAS, ATPase and Fis domain